MLGVVSLNVVINDSFLVWLDVEELLARMMGCLVFRFNGWINILCFILGNWSKVNGCGTNKRFNDFTELIIILIEELMVSLILIESDRFISDVLVLMIEEKILPYYDLHNRIKVTLGKTG